MGVKITICGADKESDEYSAALRMKRIIQEGIPSYVEGEIVLFASATLYGQVTKDVDLMMIGQLHKYIVDLDFYPNDASNEMVSGKVEIRSFCTTIEIKRHDISGISIIGTDFYVAYGNDSHCVTEQSNKQKIAAMNFFKRNISYSPYITNLIWFVQTTANEISSLQTNNNRKMLSNVMSGEVTFKEVMQLLVWQKQPYYYRGQYVFDSNYDTCSVSNIQNALELFSKSKKQMGDLTRKRIEMITNNSFSKSMLIDSNGKVFIYRGRAGTGKTVGLIQTAIRLVDELQGRVLILTYNKALVSDIRRLFALAELPDMFEEKCVSISTMQSYYYKLINSVMYSGKMRGEKFIENYETIIKEFSNFIDEESSRRLVREIIKTELQLNWDYVLIDEAQDWTNDERDIILNLYDHGNIVVADGGQQFVRNIDACDWSIISQRKNIKLKYCLRQKQNLISFLNRLGDIYSNAGAKILSNNNMPGGKVIITEDDRLMSIYKREMEMLLKAGNAAYDMLYLIPHTLVTRENGCTEFKLKKQFESNGICYWNGLDSSSRETYPIDGNEMRVLQYESSRGLEGWTVVCQDLDVFLNEKERQYKDNGANALLLESPEERKKKYMYNWLMIPMTRAIDTLVITIKDTQSDFARTLKSVSEEYRDYVFWI